MVVIALVLPVVYGLAMVLLEASFPLVPTIGYFLCLMIGGILGAVGCINLSDPTGRFRVLLGATLLIFVSEFFRGAAILLDSVVDPGGDLGSVSIFMFHGSAFLVFAFGALIFAGSTVGGKRSGLLTRAVAGEPFESHEEKETRVTQNTNDMVREIITRDKNERAGVVKDQVQGEAHRKGIDDALRADTKLRRQERDAETEVRRLETEANTEVRRVEREAEKEERRDS